ncbi:hypothetical protein M758_6G143300 [Ceratodon purpureus]|nr:hypothetical protein M758_6G143300 [Ceratodon purpureus]
MKKVQHYDLKDALPTIPVRIVRRPLYKQGAMGQEPSEDNLGDSPSGDSIASRPPSPRRGILGGQTQAGNQGSHTATGSEPGGRNRGGKRKRRSPEEIATFKENAVPQ